MSWCCIPLTCNSMKIFQMREFWRSCESLSKLILPASQSSSFSRPHTQAFLRLQPSVNMWCLSVRQSAFIYCILFTFSSWSSTNITMHKGWPGQDAGRLLFSCPFNNTSWPCDGEEPAHTLQKPLFILYLNPAGTTPPQAALWIMSSTQAELRGVGQKHDLLGTRLIAFRGLRTRTVRIADKLMFWRSREYSTILQKGKEREREKREKKKV